LLSFCSLVPTRAGRSNGFPYERSGQAGGNFAACFARYQYVILNSIKQSKLNILDLALTVFLVCAAIMVITR
jgi:hypothetical protein